MARNKSRPALELGLLATLSALALCATGLMVVAQEDTAPAEEPLPAIEGALPYEPKIEGPRNEALRETILALSELISRQEAGVPSRAALRRRVERDVEIIRKVMHSGAYYDAQITTDVERGTSSNDLIASIKIEDGPNYKIGRVKVDYVGTPLDKRPPFLVPEGPATGLALKGIEQQIVDALLETGHADMQVMDRTATLNRPDLAVDLHLVIDPGPIVHVGSVAVKGVRDVHEEHILTVANLQPGELLTPSRMRQAETDLAETGLFDSFALVPSAQAGADRPVTIEVNERLHRTIGGGVKWATDEGFGIKGFWRHRNYRGAGENVNVELEFAEIKQELSASYREPHWHRRDQALLMSAEMGHEDAEAYDETRAGVFTGLERKFSKTFTGQLGVSVEWSSSDDGSGRVDSYLVGLPGGLSWDHANDLLDPTEGYRVGVRVTPYAGWSDTVVGFVTAEGTGSIYLPLDSEKKFVFASRGRLGLTIGPSANGLPPNKRFYAGGGGSIRGYGYQRVGPLDANDNPIGGKSVIELNAELRARVMEDIGVVAFVDAGSAFEELTPRFGDDVGYAVGLGGRYYTSLGPVRLDVAVPLNKRDGDEAFQIYVSIGQAF